MPRGPLKPETKKQRTYEALQQWMQNEGVEFKVTEPEETVSDKMREAQSVINYYETKGAGFKEKPCKFCGLIFAYSWNVGSIGYCSVTCAASALKEIGLTWDPSKPPEMRWGQFVPAVVPPQALDLLKDQVDPPEG